MERATRRLFCLVFILLILLFALLCICIYGINNVVYAETTIDSSSTTWSGEMTCDDDITISSSVTVSANTTLSIAFGKTLTLEDGITISNNRTFTINGPGTLVISKADTGSSSGAFVIRSNGYVYLEGGRVIVNALGTSQYALYADKSSEPKVDTVSTKITINDGAMIVNGGTTAGIRADYIQMNRGLLYVRSTGKDDEITYGVLCRRFVVGEMDEIQHRPSVDIYEPSNSGYGISRHGSQNASFEYYGGFFECQAATQAINCNQTTQYYTVEYTGPNKEEATRKNLNDPYVFISHRIDDVESKVRHEDDYLFTMNDGRRKDSLIVTATGNIANCEGRSSVLDPLTDFDQFIKDLYCPMLYGEYGMVKDITITGGDGKLTSLAHGFSVNGMYKGLATINGKYTYFNGTDYVEVPFEIKLKVCNEVTSVYNDMVNAGRLYCDEDVTIDDPLVLFGSTLYIAAGKTLTINEGLRVYSDSTLKIEGPGKIVIYGQDKGSYSGALDIEYGASLILNDGFVSVSLTDNSPYCVFGDEDSVITINDGAMIVNGGAKAGMFINEMYLNRGLLRVNATGSNAEKTYGIFMNFLKVGINGDVNHRPTLEVTEQSANKSYGIATPDDSGDFYYNCGFVEITSNQHAFNVDWLHFYDTKIYGGQDKQNLNSNGEDNPYVLITHQPWHIPYATDYDYFLTFNDELKADSVYVTPTSETFSFEGRSSVDESLTSFDQFIKDFVHPIVNGPYGIVKDINVVGGNGQVIGTNNGFEVNGKFNGKATISGKYTYFNGTDYLEAPFEIGLTVSNGPDLTYEATSDTTITATYGTFGTYDITISAPEGTLTYDGNTKGATLVTGYNECIFPNATIEYTLNGDAITSCLNAGTYNATITFDTASVTVSFEILKANPTFTIPTNLSVVVGSTLSDVTLPSGWSWVNNTLSVGDIGNNTFKATYTPSDTQNYNVVENIDVTINVCAESIEEEIPEDINQPNEHGFCIGWIALIVGVLEVLCLLTHLIFKWYKKRKYSILGVLISIIGTIFTVLVIVKHICLFSIIAIVLSALAFIGFALTLSYKVKDRIN